MTTNVTVETHAWPVEITIVDQYGDNAPQTSVEGVPPNSKRTVYLTQTRTLSFKEMALPEEQFEQPPQGAAG